jgi:cytosine permease
MSVLPDYLAKAVPNPPTNRAPWYVNTAPSYAGVFLWIAFYESIAQGAIDRAGIGVCLLALLVELCPVLLRACHAGHENRIPALRRG